MRPVGPRQSKPSFEDEFICISGMAYAREIALKKELFLACIEGECLSLLQSILDGLLKLAG